MPSAGHSSMPTARTVSYNAASSPGSPPAWSKRLALAAPALGPFNATARLTGKAAAESSEVHLVLDGKAAGSTLGFDGSFKGRSELWGQGLFDLALRLEGPDGGLVLRQLGIAASSDAVSAGRIAVTAKG
eukprot:gene35727-48037_t